MNPKSPIFPFWLTVELNLRERTVLDVFRCGRSMRRRACEYRRKRPLWFCGMTLLRHKALRAKIFFFFSKLHDCVKKTPLTSLTMIGVNRGYSGSSTKTNILLLILFVGIRKARKKPS